MEAVVGCCGGPDFTNWVVERVRVIQNVRRATAVSQALLPRFFEASRQFCKALIRGHGVASGVQFHASFRDIPIF